MGEAKIKRDRGEFAVGIGFPCGHDVPWQTCMSLARTVHALTLLQIPCNIHAIAGSSDVVIARDAVLTKFLENDERFLFWIDSDISWAPEEFLRVLRLAKDYGVACAAYPLKRDPPDCIVNFVDEDAPIGENGLIEIQSTGLGFACVRRDIVDAFANTKEYMVHPGNNRDIIDAFRRDKRLRPDGRKQGVGEDCAFFDDLRALGHKVWLDPSIQLGHIGPKEYMMTFMEPASLAEQSET